MKPVVPMSILNQITVLIITFNEEPNIGRTLEAVKWASQILVVDSGSTDATISIAKQYPQVVILQRPFDTFAKQCNYGLAEIKTDWVLSLDADYQLSADLVAELERLVPSNEIAGYRASFVYSIFGRPLRATLYPARTVLYRRNGANYCDEGHGHRVAILGPVQNLQSKIRHDDRKPIALWFASQQKYAAGEAEYLLSASREKLGRNDSIRLLAWPAPIFVFGYTLLVKGCLFDGWAGWYYVLQRTLAEIMIALAIIDRRLRGATEKQ